MLGRGPAPGSRVEPTATRALYDPRRDLPRPEPPPKVDPDALLIGFPTNKWEATSEQRHELIAIMQARHPDKSAPELLAMLREQDPTNIYELLLGHGREGEWGPPDRFHTGGYEAPAASVASSQNMDNLGRLDSALVVLAVSAELATDQAMTRSICRPGRGPVSDREATRQALIEDKLRATEQPAARYNSDYDALTFERLAEQCQGASFDPHALGSSFQDDADNLGRLSPPQPVSSGRPRRDWYGK